MNQTVIIAVICVFAAGVFLAIPFILLKNARKRKEQHFIKQNRNKALLHLYSQKSKIDGSDITSMNRIKGQWGQQIISLEPGKHAFEGRFLLTAIEGGHNSNFKSKDVSFNIALEAGHSYTLAAYFHSPEERAAYYEGNVGKDVFTLPLETTGSSIYTKAYVICYQED